MSQRLFIGGLLPPGTDEIPAGMKVALETQLGRYSQLQEPLELVVKAPFQAYAFANITVDEKGLSLLQTRLSGSLFKGCKLRIELASQPYKEREAAKVEREELITEKERRKREHPIIAKSGNVAVHAPNYNIPHTDSTALKHGRGWIRGKAGRAVFRPRVSYRGTNPRYKSRPRAKGHGEITKLWGVRSIDLRDVCFKAGYINGEVYWIDGWGATRERQTVRCDSATSILEGDLYDEQKEKEKRLQHLDIMNEILANMPEKIE
jgi:hypothetical protein